MPTYDNPKTGVVHWISDQKGLRPRTACSFLDRFSWDWRNLDPVGVPADVTCCKCRETAAIEVLGKIEREAAEAKEE